MSPFYTMKGPQLTFVVGRLTFKTPLKQTIKDLNWSNVAIFVQKSIFV